MKMIKLLLKYRLTLIGLTITVFFIVVGIIGPIFTKDPFKINMLEKLRPPSFEHPFGTDQLGRDLLARVVYGTRYSLFLAFLISLVSFFIGNIIGILCGFYKGIIDDILSRLIDIFLSIPEFVFNIAFIGILSTFFSNTQSPYIVFFSLVITHWVSYARLSRALTFSLSEEDFILSSKLLGASNIWILKRHIFPSIFSSLLIVFVLNIGNLILTITTLGFLGLGIQPPLPEWGQILSSGKNYLSVAPWIVIFPGLMIMLSLLGINLLAEGLKDILEPKLRRLI